MEIKDAKLKFNGNLTKRKKTTEIILHCSATPEGKPFTVERIHEMHLANGWSGIGYNYYIDLYGTVWKGRGEEYVGAHTTDHNSISIGICYCGGVAKDGKTAKDTRTDDQKNAMKSIVEELMTKYPDATVHGHNEFANKACPSFKVKDWLDELQHESTQEPPKETDHKTEPVEAEIQSQPTEPHETKTEQKTENPVPATTNTNITTNTKEQKNSLIQKLILFLTKIFGNFIKTENNK